MRVRLLLNQGCWAVAVAAAGVSFLGCGGGNAEPPAASVAQSESAPAFTPAPAAQTPTAQAQSGFQTPEAYTAPATQQQHTSSAMENAAAAAASQMQPPVQSQFTAAGDGEMRVAQNTGSGAPAAEEVVPAGQPDLPPPLSAEELAAKMDLDNVPDGTPSELLKYMTDLTAVPFPNNATPVELRNFASKVYFNVLTASEKLLAAGNATSDERRDAVQFKFNAYEMLRQIVPDQAEAISQERLQFAQAIAQDKDPKVSKFARLFLFEQMLGQFAAGNQDLFNPVLEDSKFIIEDPNADVMHFNVAQNAATVFAQMGHADEAVSILETMKKAYTGSKDEQLATRAKDLDDAILQFRIVGTMIATANGEEGAGDLLVENIRAWVATKPKENLEPLQMISTIEMQMEDYGKLDVARKLAGLMLEFYGQHSDAQVVKSVSISVANAEKRINLIGKPFVVEGNTLNGARFDWEQYRGKFVLVDFWASWCPICIEEFENIKIVYEKYRAKGFEVVGVNLDDDPRARAAFFDQQGLPWATVISANPDATGFKDPNAQRCGIEALPFLVFVGPTGNVIEINPRGERLEELVESAIATSGGGVQTLSNALPGLQNQQPQQNAAPQQQTPATAEADINVKLVR